jgi:cyclic-di-GMP-binding protein
MSLSINLAPINTDSLASAETNASKVKAFSQSLSHQDTFQASSRLLEELKLLNRQKLDAATRISILELYRKITTELSNDLEEVFGNVPSPLNEESKNHAALAEALWLETGYGYKRALVDLKQKLINFKGNEQHSLVIQRAMEALKNEANINYLTYTSPSESLWADLHKLYFHALQLSLENIEVHEQTQQNNKTITLVYNQALLMNLANPQRLSKPFIRKLSHYIGSLAKYAQLRPMGYIENPTGIFLIELDSKKPPIPYLKNKNTPNVQTDILLVTVEVARHLHQQLKYIQEVHAENASQLPTSALEVVDEDLLRHLINNFGVSTSRFFPRTQKKQPAALAIGLEAANIQFRNTQRAQDHVISPWEIMNISPVGYALRTNETYNLAVTVGDLVTIKENQSSAPALGHIVWLNNKAEYIEAGIKLLSPAAESVSIKPVDSLEFENALLLPEVKALKQPASIIINKGKSAPSDVIDIKMQIKTAKLLIKSLIERTPKFDRYEYGLIDVDLS